MKILNEEWNTVVTLLPKGWSDNLDKLGVMKRKLPSFNSANELLQTILIHVGKGYSLRETSALVKSSGIAEVSDVGILKALRRSEIWLRNMCRQLFQEQGVSTEATKIANMNIKLIDSTTVIEPGKTGSCWRIHYSINLPDLSCSHFSITPIKGKGTGEKVNYFPVQTNDCFIADAGYSTASNCAYLKSNNANIIVRLNYKSMKFYCESKKIDLLHLLKEVKVANQVKEWELDINVGDNNFIKGRVCVVRKSNKEIEKSIKKLRRKASKKQINIQPETYDYNKYIILFTTVQKEKMDSCQILNWYRVRWQIELIFKRFKSIAGLGHLPKYDDISSRAWLYAKLFLCLLSQKLIDHAKKISPWGYAI